jgi:hypothetical protein
MDMIKLMSLFAVLLLLSGGVAIHFLRYDRASMHAAIASVVTVSQMAQPARGAAWYEGRFVHRTESSSNPAYPELKSASRSDFVYAQ